jgi:hypothetical protein
MVKHHNLHATGLTTPFGYMEDIILSKYFWQYAQKCLTLPHITIETHAYEARKNTEIQGGGGQGN